MFEKTHDELDFEFLGNVGGKPWRFQTNLYGDGSTHRGREERYRLWFDPTKQFHRYSILWSPTHIMYVYHSSSFSFNLVLFCVLYVDHPYIFSKKKDNVFFNKDNKWYIYNTTGWKINVLIL